MDPTTVNELAALIAQWKEQARGHRAHGRIGYATGLDQAATELEAYIRSNSTYSTVGL